MRITSEQGLNKIYFGLIRFLLYSLSYTEKTLQQEFGQNDGATDGAIDGATKALKRKLAVLIKAIWNDEGKNTADYTPLIRTLAVNEHSNATCSNSVKVALSSLGGMLHRLEVIT